MARSSYLGIGRKPERVRPLAQSRTGVCELCGEAVAKADVRHHLTGCAPGHDSGHRQERLIQLEVEAAGAPEYWLYVEGRESASLQQVDSVLRRTWLECCGHMSAFRVGRLEAAKRSPLGVMFRTKGLGFTYEYDFGSTTALKGKVIGFRSGSIGRAAVRLIARNAPLPWACEEKCGAQAVVVCPFCIHSGPSLFCKTHAPSHPCADEEVWLPVVNSPRMGVCGYTG